MMGDVRYVKITKLKKKYWGRDGVMMMILIRETLLYRQKITTTDTLYKGEGYWGLEFRDKDRRK